VVSAIFYGIGTGIGIGKKIVESADTTDTLKENI
jgi:hypothetical protein